MRTPEEEHAYRKDFKERRMERQILEKLIADDVGLTKGRGTELKEVFAKRSGNETKEELEQTSRQRLEGVAEMAMVRLNAVRAGFSKQTALLEDHNPKPKYIS